MIKVVIKIFLMLLLSEFALAESNNKLACSNESLQWSSNAKYIKVAGNDLNPIILADLSTMSFDKESKILKIQIVSLASSSLRESIAKEELKLNRISNFGYTKIVYFIDYINNKFKTNHTVHYNCDGSMSLIYDNQGNWTTIEKGSSENTISDNLLTKVNAH